MTDRIVEEVRRVKEELAARFNYYLGAKEPQTIVATRFESVGISTRWKRVATIIFRAGVI